MVVAAANETLHALVAVMHLRCLLENCFPDMVALLTGMRVRCSLGDSYQAYERLKLSASCTRDVLLYLRRDGYVVLTLRAQLAWRPRQLHGFVFVAGGTRHDVALKTGLPQGVCLPTRGQKVVAMCALPL